MPLLPLDTTQLEDRVTRAAEAWHAGVQVGALERIAAGSSSVTMRGHLVGSVEGEIIVRVAPPGLEPVRNRDVLRQARVQSILFGTDIPVPEVLFQDIGAPPEVPPFFVMRAVRGDSFEPLVDEIERLPTPDDLTLRSTGAAQLLGLMHRFAPDDLLGIAEDCVPLSAVIERWRAMFDATDSGLEHEAGICAEALRQSAPSELPGRLVHGDFRMGNIIYDGNSIAAVLDWEIWSWADPRIDVGWFLMTLDADRLPSAIREAPKGLPSKNQLLDAYQGTSGVACESADWFIALACFRGAAAMALNVKHNRRQPHPESRIERYASLLPEYLHSATALVERAQ